MTSADLMSWRYALSFSSLLPLEMDSEIEETLVLNDFKSAEVESDAENANRESEPDAVSRDAHCEKMKANVTKKTIGPSDFLFI